MRYLRARWAASALSTSVWLLLGGLLLVLAYLEWAPLRELTPFPAVGLLVALYWLLSLPLDWLGGYWLPQQHARSHQGLGPWVMSWLKGSLVQGLFLWLNAGVLILATRWLGWVGALGWLFISMLLLQGFQFYLHLALTWAAHRMENNQGRLLFLVDHQDQGFTGGIFGIPGKESIVYPRYWRERFPEDVNRLLVARRHGAVNTGSHGRGVLWALGWNLLLFAGALLLSPELPSTAVGVLGTVGAYTLLSGLTLLLPMPWLSRRGVYEVDRWAYYQRMDPDQLRHGIELTHRLRDDTGERLPFASLRTMPTRAMREAHFAQQKDVKGAWQAAHQALYISWAGLNLLNRSLPDQLGRPELWVFAPSD